MKTTLIAAGLLLSVGTRANVEGCSASSPTIVDVALEPVLAGDGALVEAEVSFVAPSAGVTELAVSCSDLQHGETFDLTAWDPSITEWNEGVLPVDLQCHNATATDVEFTLGFGVRDKNGSDVMYKDVTCLGTNTDNVGPSDPVVTGPAPFAPNKEVLFWLDYHDTNGGVSVIHVRNTSCPAATICDSVDMPMTNSQAIVQTFSSARIYLSTFCGNASMETLRYSYAISLEDSQGHVTGEVPVHFECQPNFASEPIDNNVWMYYAGEEGESLLQLDFALGDAH